MSRAQRRSRWALSLADLCLLLLGFFVLLQAHASSERAMAGLNTYFSDGEGTRPIEADIPASTLFVAREAMLTPAGKVRILGLVREVRAADAIVRISSQGTDAGTNASPGRFDGWDLASARVGAVARAFMQAGLRPDRIRIAGPDSDFAEGETAQTLLIRSEPARR